MRAFSFPGDCVLNPFAGSGTALLACRELGRECVGIEVEPEYAGIIRGRIGAGAVQRIPDHPRTLSPALS